MKTTLKVALLASVLMATPALAADKSDNSPSDEGRTMASEKPMVDANGNPVHRKHWHHNRANNGDASMNDAKSMNRDANPHRGNAPYVTNGYRDANGNWHNGVSRQSREYVYNDYYNRTGQRTWMGMDLNTRHMTDGSDTDANNRGRHAFIFDNGQNPQDFRVGSGHVVKH